MLCQSFCALELACFSVDPDPPQNFAVALLSPSTAEFTWEPPEDSINELFILSCEPQLQQSTRNTMLIARDLTPNTNYTCKLFTAHAINIHNSSATIHFKTCTFEHYTASIYANLATPAEVVSKLFSLFSIYEPLPSCLSTRLGAQLSVATQA